MTIVDVGNKPISFYFQGRQAARFAPNGEHRPGASQHAALDLSRLRRLIRPLLARPTLIIFHVNRRCRGVTGSWYGRARTFRYFNHHYRGFDGDVVTLVLNPLWFARRRVIHGPYYLAAARHYRSYPAQPPMDAVAYVLAHEFAHHYLYSRRHPLRFSERVTDLFALSHLYQVEPTHPIARHVKLTNRELGLLLELLRRMPRTHSQRHPLAGRSRVACKRVRRA